MNSRIHIGMMWLILLSVTRASAFAQRAAAPAQRSQQTGPTDTASVVNSLLFTAQTRKVPRPNVLVIPSIPLEQEEIAPIVEDMEIMSRVFDKALGHKSPGYVTRYVTEAVDSALRRYAMRNDSSVPEQTRGIFLAGYGAIFLTEVDYPLAPGPDKSEAAKEADVKESVWEETKRELSGRPELAYKYYHARIRVNHRKGSPIQYDAKKVDQLTETLLEALKHATNIRSLGPEDSVAVVVQGGYSTNDVRLTRRSVPIGTALVPLVETAAPVTVRGASSRTVLTLHVKKSDIDAFARGAQSFDDWRSKAAIVTY